MSEKLSLQTSFETKLYILIENKEIFILVRGIKRKIFQNLLQRKFDKIKKANYFNLIRIKLPEAVYIGSHSLFEKTNNGECLWSATTPFLCINSRNFYHFECYKPQEKAMSESYEWDEWEEESRDHGTNHLSPGARMVKTLTTCATNSIIYVFDNNEQIARAILDEWVVALCAAKTEQNIDSHLESLRTPKPIIACNAGNFVHSGNSRHF